MKITLNKLGQNYTPFQGRGGNLKGNILSVTREHIKKGKAGDCGKCPVALALLDGLPNATKVSVDEDSIIVVEAKGNGRTVSYHVPRSVERFINNFDDEEPVKPFAFKLERI
jgi:hypothetical protein